MRTHTLDGTTVLADCAEVPGLGHLPVNAFVIAADQPVLVDTGLPASREQFLDRLWAVCDPADLRWIWLTHPDRDHTGALQQVLDAAPQARIVTTFLGLGLLSIEHQVPPDRVFLLNPGQALDVGDRQLRALRPPLYDSPATTGLLDESTGALYSSDCFGAPLPSADLALGDDAADVPPAELGAAQGLWATVDSPWIAQVDRSAYRGELSRLAALGLPLVLSTHLPPARHRGRQLLETLAGAPDLPPFVGPDQAALERLLADFAPATRT